MRLKGESRAFELHKKREFPDRLMIRKFPDFIFKLSLSFPSTTT